MIFNNIKIDIGNIEASYDRGIEITSKDHKYSFAIDFNQEENNIRNMELNKRISIIKFIYWDVSLREDETSYLFDLTKDEVYLTRLDDNKYRLEIYIKDPEMIYTYDSLDNNKKFDSFSIDTVFSFDK